jgi:hypothetical protein
VVARRYARAVPEEELDTEPVTLVRGPHEGGVPVRVGLVDGDRLLELESGVP